MTNELLQRLLKIKSKLIERCKKKHPKFVFGENVKLQYFFHNKRMYFMIIVYNYDNSLYCRFDKNGQFWRDYRYLFNDPKDKNRIIAYRFREPIIFDETFI